VPQHARAVTFCRFQPPIINRAEGLKRSKYAEAAEALSAGFVPFIVTIQGEIGPAATALLKSLEDRAGKLLNLDCKLLLTLTIQGPPARAHTWQGSGVSPIGGEGRDVE
jgi:hypothetical protein